MICKYCGTQIAFGEKLCPRCGESTVKTIYEGGNGFWDIVGQEPVKDESNNLKPKSDVSKPDSATVKERVIIKKLPLKRTVLTCSVLCILSALCLIFSVISSISVKNNVIKLEAVFNSISMSEKQIRVSEEPEDFEKSTFVNTGLTPTTESSQITEDINIEQEKNTKSTVPFPAGMPTIKTELIEDEETDSMDKGVELEQENPEEKSSWWPLKKG